MGIVWAAQHTLTGKRVALKFLRGPIHLRPELRQRFFREARAATAVVHPNVLEVHDVFELEDETPVMLMDLLEGETLGRRIERQGVLSLTETADIMVQAISAVGTAHAAGVVHRDLKPENVYLVAKGGASSVRVLDFGIAKLVGADPSGDSGLVTGTGAILGTPCYMSPEQSYGERFIDHRADIWSLGAILYECLSGVRPVEGDSLGQVVKNLVVGGIVPISSRKQGLPDDVVKLVDRMLTREREARLPELSEALAILLRHTQVRPPEFGPAKSHESQPSPDIPMPSTQGAPVTDHASVGTAATIASAPGVAAQSAPVTAVSHTMTSPGATRSPSRARWLVPLGLVALVGALVVLVWTRAEKTSPTTSTPPSAMTPASMAVTGAPAPVVAEEPTLASAAAIASPIAVKVSSPAAPRPVAHRAALAKPQPSAPPAAPAPQPARLGGLAEKPPF